MVSLKRQVQFLSYCKNESSQRAKTAEEQVKDVKKEEEHIDAIMQAAAESEFKNKMMNVIQNSIVPENFPRSKSRLQFSTIGSR